MNAHFYISDHSPRDTELKPFEREASNWFPCNRFRTAFQSAWQRTSWHGQSRGRRAATRRHCGSFPSKGPCAILSTVIGWLSGIVIDRDAAGLILDVGGVGYEVTLSAELLRGRGAPGEELALWIHTHATAESPSATLYGFVTPEQRRVFRLLLRVKGIGPRLAQAIVSHLGGEGVATAVRAGDIGTLCSVSGVGKKTAQQIILDLAGQLGALETVAHPMPSELNQVASALVNLGFRRIEADRALRTLRDRRQIDGPFDEVLKRALAFLREM